MASLDRHVSVSRKKADWTHRRHFRFSFPHSSILHLTFRKFITQKVSKSTIFLLDIRAYVARKCIHINRYLNPKLGIETNKGSATNQTRRDWNGNHLVWILSQQGAIASMCAVFAIGSWEKHTKKARLWILVGFEVHLLVSPPGHPVSHSVIGLLEHETIWLHDKNLQCRNEKMVRIL